MGGTLEKRSPTQRKNLEGLRPAPQQGNIYLGPSHQLVRRKRAAGTIGLFIPTCKLFNLIDYITTTELNINP